MEPAKRPNHGTGETAKPIDHIAEITRAHAEKNPLVFQEGEVTSPYSDVLEVPPGAVPRVQDGVHYIAGGALGEIRGPEEVIEEAFQVPIDVQGLGHGYRPLPVVQRKDDDVPPRRQPGFAVVADGVRAAPKIRRPPGRDRRAVRINRHRGHGYHGIQFQIPGERSGAAVVKREKRDDDRGMPARAHREGSGHAGRGRLGIVGANEGAYLQAPLSHGQLDVAVGSPVVPDERLKGCPAAGGKHKLEPREVPRVGGRRPYRAAFRTAEPERDRPKIPPIPLLEGVLASGQKQQQERGERRRKYARRQSRS